MTGGHGAAAAAMTAKSAAEATVTITGATSGAAVTGACAASIAAGATVASAVEARCIGAAGQRHHQHNTVHSVNLLLTETRNIHYSENRSRMGSLAMDRSSFQSTPASLARVHRVRS